MTAQKKYFSSLIELFSAFLTWRQIPAAHQPVLVSLLTDFFRWSNGQPDWQPSTLAKFFQHQSQHRQNSLPARHRSLLIQFATRQALSQTEIFIKDFLLALQTDGCSKSTIKNYRSDIQQFLSFSAAKTLAAVFTKPKLDNFARWQRQKSLKDSSITRKLSSVIQYGLWLKQTDRFEMPPAWLQPGYIHQLPAATSSQLPTRLASTSEKLTTTPPPQLANQLALVPQAAPQPENQSANLITKLGVLHPANPKTTAQLALEVKSSRQPNQSAPVPAGPNSPLDSANSTAAPADFRTRYLSLNWPKNFRPHAQRNQEQRAKLKTNFSQLADQLRAKIRHTTALDFLPLLNMAIIGVFFLGLAALGYQQFFKNAAINYAYPTSPVTPGRTLSFQGRLTNKSQTPIDSLTNMNFVLYDDPDAGSPVWTSNTCSIDPDQDGIFSVGLGDLSECGPAITDDVFSENPNLWLEVTVDSETLDPRQAIRTVGYALNSETLQGFPLGNQTTGATKNTILALNNSGQLLIGEANPEINSTSGTFTIEGQALVLQTATGTNGNISLQPDGTGAINLLASDVFINQYLKHTSDSDTYLEMPTAGDQLKIVTGGVELVSLTEDDTQDIITIGSSTNDTDINLNNDLAIEGSSGNVGIGTTTFTHLFNVNGNLGVTSGNDLFIGSVGLNDVGTSNTTSGASLIGVYYNELTYSTSTNVQDVLDDLDAAISSAGGENYWVDNITDDYLTPNSINSNNLYLGASGKLAINYLPVNVTDAVAAFNGNVAIGTSTATSALTVNGNIGASGLSLTSIALVSDPGYVLTSASAGSGALQYLDTSAWDKTGSDDLTSLTEGDDIDISGTGNDRTIALEDDIDVTAVRASSASGLSLFDDGGNGIFVEDGGNVGIGTISPRGNFQSHTATGQSSVNISTDDNVGAGNTTILSFLSDLDGTPAAASIGQFNSGDLKLSAIGNLVIPDMTILAADGNVGIGTTSPTGALEVFRSGDQANLIVSTDVDLGLGSSTQLTFSSDSDGASPSSAAIGQYNGDGLRLSGSGSLISPDAIIDTNGNLGIGLTSPAAQLVVADTSGASHALFQNTNTGYTATDGFRVGIDAAGAPSIWNYENLGITFGTNNTGRMAILNTGELDMNELDIINTNSLEFFSGSEYIIRVNNDNDTGVYFDASTNRWQWREDTENRLTIDLDDGGIISHVGGDVKMLSLGDETTSAFLGSFTETGDVFLRNLSEFRFGDTNNLDWNDWAGITYSTSDTKLVIGGPTSTYFTDNFATSTDDPHIIFDGIKNVGIGTTTPIAKTHLYNSVATGTFLNSDTDFLIDDTDARLQLRSADDGTNGSGIALTTGNSSWTLHTQGNTGNSFFLGYRESSGNEDMFLNATPALTAQADGNVGIGTASPTAKFDVWDNTIHLMQATNEGSEGIVYADVFKDFSGGSSTLFNLDLNDATSLQAAGRILIGGDSSVDVNDWTGLDSEQAADNQIFLHFGHALDSDTGSTFSSVMTLDYNGNFGIGTTRPGAKLDVRNSGTEDILNLYDGSTEVMSVIDGGNVGIGVADPVNLVEIKNDASSLTDSSPMSDYHLGLFSTNMATGQIGMYFTAYGTGEATGSLPPGAAITHERVGSYSQGKLHFKTRGSTTAGDPVVTRMTIDENGYVGIGTTGPSHLLSVAGSVATAPQPAVSFDNNDWFTLAHNGGYGSINFFAEANGSDYYTTHASVKASQIASVDGGIAFKNALTNPGSGTAISWTEVMRIVGSNVGIGTTGPAAKLEVYESTQLGTTLGDYQILSKLSGYGTNKITQNHWLYRDAAGGTSWTTARLHDGISIDASYGVPNSTDRTWWERDPYNILQSWGHLSLTFMTLDSAGNLGIGTTNPGARLQIYHDSNPEIRLSNPASDAFEVMGSLNFYQTAVIADSVAKIDVIRGGSYYNEGHLRFYTNPGHASSSGTSLERMRITSAGNVGIGTTTASHKLEVNGAISLNGVYTSEPGSTGGLILNDSGGSYGTKAELEYYGSGIAVWGPNSNKQSIAFRFPNNNDSIGFFNDKYDTVNNLRTITLYSMINNTGTALMRFNSNGNVGIGPMISTASDANNPAALLDLATDAGVRVPTLRISDIDTGAVAGQTHGQIEFYKADASGTAGVVANIRYINDDSAAPGNKGLFQIQTGRPADGLTTRLSIDANTGAVGIGTTGFDYSNRDLQIMDGTSHTSVSIKAPNNTSVSQLMFEDNTGKNWYISDRNNYSNQGYELQFTYYDGANWLKPLTLEANGNVGIFSTSANARLQVNDNGASTTTPMLMVGDDTYFVDIDTVNTVGLYGASSGSWGYLKSYITNPSSASYKNQIEHIPVDDQEILTALKEAALTRYFLNGETNNPVKHLGIIAEESPLVVRDRNSNQGIDSYDYTSLALFGAKYAVSQIENLSTAYSLTDTGDYSLAFSLDSINPANSTAQITQVSTGSLLSRAGVFSQALIAQLQAGLINASQLITTSLTATTATIAESLTATRATFTDSLTATRAAIAELTTTKLKIGNFNFTGQNGLLEIKDAHDQTIATIDDQGRAHLSGLVIDESASSATSAATSPIADPMAEPATATSSATTALGELLANDIQTANLTADQITATDLTATGSSKLGQLLANQADIGQLTTDQLAISNQLEITNSSQQSIANLDETGNLTIAGEFQAALSRLDYLQAKVAEVENIKTQTAEIVNATVSGTLYANHIAGFDDKVAAAFRQTSLLGTLLGETTTGDSLPADEALTDFIVDTDVATSSASLKRTIAELNLTENDVVITPQAAYVNQYFQVNGYGYIAESLGIGQKLVIGDGLQIASNYLEYLDPTLPEASQFLIQPSGLGSVSILADRLIIDDSGLVSINGNLAVSGDALIAGNLTVQDTLLTNLIEPENYDQPTRIKVAGVATESGEVKRSSLQIVDETGTPVATISATGRAEFADGIGLDNEDLSNQEVASGSAIVANKTSGKAKISAGQKHLTIRSEKITDQTQVFITPVGSTNNQVLYVKDQTTENPDTSEKEGQFVVGFDLPASDEAEFNWWLVN